MPTRSGPAYLAAESARVLGIYVKGQVLIFLWEIVLYLAGFALLRVPLWWLIAPLCAFLGLIPRLGSLLALGLALFATWTGDASILRVCEVLAVWVIVQAVEGFYLTPRLLGKPLGLRPMWVFLALLLGSLLLGPIGFFVAVPVLAIALVFVRYFRRSQPAVKS